MAKYNVRLEHRAKDEQIVDADFFAVEDGFVLFKKKHATEIEVVAAFAQHGVEFIKKDGQP